MSNLPFRAVTAIPMTSRYHEKTYLEVIPKSLKRISIESGSSRFSLLLACPSLSGAVHHHELTSVLSVSGFSGVDVPSPQAVTYAALPVS